MLQWVWKASIGGSTWLRVGYSLERKLFVFVVLRQGFLSLCSRAALRLEHLSCTSTHLHSQQTTWSQQSKHSAGAFTLLAHLTASIDFPTLRNWNYIILFFKVLGVGKISDHWLMRSLFLGVTVDTPSPLSVPTWSKGIGPLLGFLCEGTDSWWPN